MKKIYYFVLFGFLFAAILMISCDDTLTNTDIDNKIIPSKDVSFGEYIQPLFQVKCNSSSCHNSKDQAGGLNLESHYGATNNSLVVFPGIPDNSKLVWSIEGRSNFPMPPIGYPPLTKNQIDGIKTWIKEGAKNN
jgi:hypothetical protein